MSFKMPRTNVEARLRENSISTGSSEELPNGTGIQLKPDGDEFKGVIINLFKTQTVTVQGSNPDGIAKVRRALGMPDA